MLDEQFLKILRNKLAYGSTNSALLNCIPGTSLSKIDAFDFNLIQDGLAGEFIKKLFTEEGFTFNISYQTIVESELEEERKLMLELLSKRLNRIYNDNELSFQEKGHRTFGFGYPLFVVEIEDGWVKKKVGAKEKEKRLICAPLFIWPLEIQKSYKQNRTWIIRKPSDALPFINDTFVSFIKQKRQVDLGKTLGGETEEQLTYSVLERKVSKIVNAVNTYDKTTSEILVPNEYIFPLHTKNQLKEKATINGFIEWSGVFSLFSKQKQSLINEIDQLIERKEEFIVDEDSRNPEDRTPSIFTHGFTATDTDHSQQAVIDQLNKDTKFVIQGPPGTGKSQTLTALITNALSSGAKCLIVCEKNTALEIIYDNLSNMGLGDLCAFINDPIRDRRKIVEKVRSTPLMNYPGFFDIKFNTLTDELRKQINDLSKGYESLAAIIWGDQTWSNILGRYLKAKKIVKNNPLKDALKEIDWELSTEEHHRYTSILTKLEELNIETSFSTEEELNNEFFADERKTYIKEKIQDICSKQILLAYALEKKFGKIPAQYENELKEYYRSIDIELDNLLENFNNYYGQIQRIAPQLIESSPTTIRDNLTKVSALFSPKIKRGLEYRKEILKAYKNIHKASTEIVRMKANLLPDPEFMSIKALKENLDVFKETYKTFIANSRKQITERVNEILSKNKEVQGATLTSLNNIINDYKFFVEKINQSQLFNNKIQFDEKINFYNQQKKLNKIINNLELIKNSMKYFSPFYDYKSFFLKLDGKEKKVVKIFTGYENKNKQSYISIFDHFYLEKILLHNEKLDLPKDTAKLESLYQKIDEFKKILINKILSTFSKKQWSSISSYPQYKSLYNIRGAGGQRRNSLRQIINHDFNFFTNFFPVVLTNPTACATLFPLAQDIFNIVIFDEASQLRLEDTYSALLRGKIKVISGDQHQMPPPRAYEPSDSGSNDDEEDNDLHVPEEKIIERNITSSLANSESLLDYVLTKGYKKTPLLVHYRSNHSDLIEFSNNAFYSGNLLPIIKHEDYISIIYERVNGLYVDRTNPAEADKAIEILDKLVDVKKGICPSVGIATFNLYQRDLINEKLGQKAASDPNFAEKLSMLNSNSKPLFVKNLENIQGDERDVIIITTTFGKDGEGKFRKHFGPLNNKNGYRLLNVIVTRAKNKLYICTSIPEEEILKYESELKKIGKNDGVPIVLAYLAYAKAISEKDKKQASHILELLKTLSTEEKVSQPHNIETESPFEDEVYEEMIKMIKDPTRIKSQVWVGSFRVDFLISPKAKNRRSLIIECDGATYHGSTEAYAYDYFRMKQLEESGYIIYKIWSTNWWDEEDFLSEIKNLKLLFEEYDREPKIDSRFYDPPAYTSKIDSGIERQINSDLESKEISTGFTTEVIVDEDNDDEQVLTEKDAISAIEKVRTLNKKKRTDNVNQPSLFQVNVEGISTNSDLWFKLSHWGKETKNFTSFQNRFCYSLGMYITKKNKLTVKQEAYGKTMFQSAFEKGFKYFGSKK